MTPDDEQINVVCAWCEDTRTFKNEEEWRESGWCIFIEDTEDGFGAPVEYCSAACAISGQ